MDRRMCNHPGYLGDFVGRVLAILVAFAVVAVGLALAWPALEEQRRVDAMERETRALEAETERIRRQTELMRREGVGEGR